MTFKPDFKSKSEDYPEGYNDLPEEERGRIMNERIRLLHVYAQPFWHAECRLVGNRNALIVLRDAINAALRDGKSETGEMTTDGEGYTVEIELCDRPWDSPEWKAMRLPYTADFAMDRGDDNDECPRT